MSPRGWQQGDSVCTWHAQQSETPQGAWAAGVQRAAGFGGDVGRRSAGHKPGRHRRAVPAQMPPNPALHRLMPARHPSPPPQPGGAGTFLLPRAHPAPSPLAGAAGLLPGGAFPGGIFPGAASAAALKAAAKAGECSGCLLRCWGATLGLGILRALGVPSMPSLS